MAVACGNDLREPLLHFYGSQQIEATGTPDRRRAVPSRIS
jgi:hypothetical protein